MSMLSESVIRAKMHPFASCWSEFANSRLSPRQRRPFHLAGCRITSPVVASIDSSRWLLSSGSSVEIRQSTLIFLIICIPSPESSTLNLTGLSFSMAGSSSPFLTARHSPPPTDAYSFMDSPSLYDTMARLTRGPAMNPPNTALLSSGTERLRLSRTAVGAVPPAGTTTIWSSIAPP